MREPTFSAASTKLPILPLKGTFSPLYTLAHIYTLFIMPSVNRAVLTNYRDLTDRRAAAMLLAIRLYEADHGAAPANLYLLVPAYLPAVPVDPFSKDGHQLRYIATPRAEVVYSVGEDGRDDGGSTQLLRAISGRTPGPWDTIDAVFPLHPAPLLPPATEPVSGN
jgi:type II secretory pathway pseudopilin PulG